MTLLEAINHAMEHNRSIRQAALNLAETSVAVEETRAAMGLRWSPEAGASALADQDNFFVGLQARRRLDWGGEAGVRGGYADQGGDTGAYLQFDLRQPLFRHAGTRIAQEPATLARQAALDARRDLELNKAAVMIEVVRAYENVLRFERQTLLDREARDRLEALAVLTEAKEAMGTATRLDTLRVELQVGEARTALENSLDTLALEREDFIDRIGWTGGPFQLIAPPLLEPVRPTLPDAIATARSNRLDYARSLDHLGTTERQILIARRNLMPDVSITTSYRLRGGQDNRDAWDLAEEDWFAGFTAEPGLDRYAQRAAAQRSMARRDQALLAIEEMEYTIERDVKEELRNQRRAAANYRIALRNTDLAWKRLELAASMFRMGQSDNFSVTDAESAHSTAVAAELAARAEASLSGYRLLRALGLLLESPHELKPRY